MITRRDFSILASFGPLLGLLGKPTKSDSSIRWFRESDRIPACEHGIGFYPVSFSRRVLAVAGGTVLIARRRRIMNEETWIGSAGDRLHAVTHWAELPIPPEDT